MKKNIWCRAMKYKNMDIPKFLLECTTFSFSFSPLFSKIPMNFLLLIVVEGV
jgi:hypothetical protein